MQLDVRTLVVLTSLCALMMGAGVFLVAERSSPSVRPLRLWGAGCLIYGFSWALTALHGVIPGWISIVAANTIMAGAVMLNWHSVHEFGEHRFWRGWYGTVTLVAAFEWFFVYVVPSYDARVMGLSLGGTAICFLCGGRMWRFRSGQSSRAQRMTSLVFAACGLFSLERAVDTLLHLGREAGLSSVGTTSSVFFCANLLCVVLLTFGIVLVSHERANAELQRLATVDALTDTWNRATVEKLANAALEKAHRSKTPVSLVLGDIDHFKKINDTLGHAGGDLALRAVARTLEGALRAGDHLGRFGGEEFLIVAPSTDADDALALATRLCEAIASSNINGLEGVTISFGVATSRPDDRLDLSRDLFREADAALYAAKAAGRNRAEMFAPSLSSAPPAMLVRHAA